MDRHDVRLHPYPHPAHAHAAWAALSWRWLSCVRADRVPLLALFLGVLAPLWAFGALAEDVWTREVVAAPRPYRLWRSARTDAGTRTTGIIRAGDAP